MNHLCQEPNHLTLIATQTEPAKAMPASAAYPIRPMTLPPIRSTLPARSQARRPRTGTCQLDHASAARPRCLLLALLSCWLVPLSTSADPIVLTSNLTISETDTTYDGADLVIDGPVTVAINGPHSFSSLLLTNGAVLTHSPCASAETHRLAIEVAGTVSVSANSRIDVSGKGYLPGRTTGNQMEGAATGPYGGSHGGLGWGGVSAVYGDYAMPEDWGSGSGPQDGWYSGTLLEPGPEGGQVRVRTGVLMLDGQLVADASSRRAAAAGGGVLVTVEELRGGGLIRASGGSGHRGGGGGRIAVYAGDWSGFDLARITAPGGYEADAGSVYLRQGSLTTHAHYSLPGRLLTYPTNNYLVRSPTTLTGGLSIHFSRPMDLASFSPGKWVIDGPAGRIVPTDVSEAGDRLYRFELPPKTQNGSYHVTLFPTLLDAYGLPLDQDVNGIRAHPLGA